LSESLFRLGVEVGDHPGDLETAHGLGKNEATDDGNADGANHFVSIVLVSHVDAGVRQDGSHNQNRDRLLFVRQRRENDRRSDSGALRISMN
jgi:hypothetical protein